MSRAQLTSTVEQNTGGAVAPYVAGKNKIINGDFGIWARGTSFSNPTSSTYSADRWIGYSDATSTVSQVAFDYGASPASDKLPISGQTGTYFLRINKSSGGSYAGLQQKIEDVHTFAGQTVTVSFWAKASVGGYVLAGDFGQNFGSGGSASTDSFTITPTLTTSWQRFSYTYTFPSITGKTIGAGSYVVIDIGRNLTGSAALIMDFWGVQLEAGPVATPFTTASGTLQGELALCQRYYVQFGGTVSTPSNGAASTTVINRMPFPLPTAMRTTPSATYSGTPQVYDGVTLTNITGLGSVFNSYNLVTIDVSVASGLTQYRPYVLYMNSGTINLSAEL